LDAVLPWLLPQEERTVRFRLLRSVPKEGWKVLIDPDNEILEADEDNNQREWKKGFLSW
jgi:subtilase family serine protease